MPLDPATLAKVESWLVENCPNLACPVCQSQTWGTGDIGFLLILREGKLTYTGSAMPLLPLVCKKCAYTHLFSAVRMGLFPQNESPSDPDK
jgi:hypothetical protein